MSNSIISAFKKIRADNKLTQAKFAEKLGFSAGHIGTVEQGRSKPSYELMEKIIELYDFDANLFFRDTSKPISVDKAKVMQSVINKMQDTYSQFSSEFDLIIREAEVPDVFSDE